MESQLDKYHCDIESQFVASTIVLIGARQGR